MNVKLVVLVVFIGGVATLVVLAFWARVARVWSPAPHKELSMSGEVPPKGIWLSPNDPEVLKYQQEHDAKEAEDQRREELSQKSLTELLAMFNNDIAAALEAKGLTDGEPANEITVISDGMLNGDLSDAEFAQLKQLPNLRRIWIRGIQLTDDGLAVLGEMPQVEELLLEDYAWRDNRLTDACLIHIAKLPRLKQLALEETAVTGAGMSHLKHPELVRDLSFHKSPVDNAGLAQIARFTELERLCLWESQVTDAGLKALRESKSLIDLDLYQTAVTNIGVQYLVALPALEELRLTDTQANDGCLQSLLAMRKLRRVSFGDDKVSVGTVERLKQAGIEVDHGTVLNLRRETNVLRYAGTDYEVDQQRSALRAFLRPDGEISWQLEIECTDAYVPENTQPAHLEGPPMKFSGGNWRDLVGQEFRVTFNDADVHPILPDNPSNIYIGYHACPNNHHVKILKRTGRRFFIEWTCIAKQDENDPGEPVYLLAEIPFSTVVVWSDKKVMSVQQAADLAHHYFPTNDLALPQGRRIKTGRRRALSVGIRDLERTRGVCF